MKKILKKIVLKAAVSAYEKGDLPSSDFPEVELEEPKVKTHGDLSTNMAMIMAKTQKMQPRKIAEAILNNIEDPKNVIDNTEVAGPGFINFFINTSAWHPFLHQIHEQDASYGSSDIGKGQKIQVEFVSANPTGPLHVGHGRGAAVGDSVASILSFCGYDVEKEYYINDSGRQIRTLGLSVFMRFRELSGETIVFPEDCYQGRYIYELAGSIKERFENQLKKKDEEDAIQFCAQYAADNILNSIKEDLDIFGVSFDNWYSEQSLFNNGKVDSSIKDLKKRQIIYEKDGASWFKTSDFGDEKDRVVVRQNGLTTYFASDIAYHRDKFDRGFDKVIDVWGADHHGYIPRIKASITASGVDEKQFGVILVQLVNLLRDGEPVAMSTRKGEFVTLKDVVDEVGKDAARFIFLTRHYESPLDFDLELAKKKSKDNPVYYVQYGHARIANIIRKAREEKGIMKIDRDDKAIALLTAPEEIELIKSMSLYPEVVKASALFLEPHRITFYLMNLASSFHTYYNQGNENPDMRVVTNDPLLTKARLYLSLAVQKIIKNGLAILGVSAPEKM